MARYYPHAGEDLQVVSRNLVAAAGDHPHTVTYYPGDGVQGYFEVPDDVLDAYDDGDAIEAYNQRLQADEEYYAADATLRQAPATHEPTLEDMRPVGQKTNTVQGNVEPMVDKPTRGRGRRAAEAKTEE